ncbi:MAG: hypothetical protein Kow0068_26550 [Marinilabiliales bacterium]
MKKLLFLLTGIFGSLLIYAQGPIGEGESQINVGLGFSNFGLPIYAGFDHGVHEDVTVGGEISYRSYSDTWLNNKYSHTIIGISGNGNYHFNNLLEIPSEFDFYAGLSIGFFIWSSSADYDGTGASGLGVAAQIGGRWYFSDKFSLNLELGGGNYVSAGKIGLTIAL